MTPSPSSALLQLENLFGLCAHHVQVCADPDCRVSVTFARVTAMRLAAQVDDHEKTVAREVLERWPV